MAKASPAKNIFEGEFSPLAQGRTDVDRYARSMRDMTNFVTAKQGPAIKRSGTQFGHMAKVPYDIDIEDRQYSGLYPFAFNENEVLMMEFSNLKLRWHYQYDGLLSNEETAPTIVVANSPVKITIPGHVYVVGDTITFQDFPPEYGINDRLLTVTVVAGNDVTFAYTAPLLPLGAIPGVPYASRVYEIDTPYAAKDVRKLRVRQWLDTCYIFCDGYRPRVLQRYGLFDWRMRNMEFKDGPYLPINETNTRLTPNARGTWIPEMTANNAPSGLANASTESVGHEAFRAFDGIIESYWESTSPQFGVLQYDFIALTNQIPVMTAPTTGGVTISASSESGGNEAWHVRDGNNETDWRTAASPGGNVPHYIQIDFGVNKTILQYTLRASRARKEFSMRDWTLSGAAAPGGPYTVVDTRINVKWKSGEKQLFTVQAPGAYRYYRLNVTQVNRIEITTVIKAEGKPGKPGYKKKKTITTNSDPRVSIANMEMFIAVGLPHVVDGYCIQMARNNNNDDHPSRHYAPTTWTFEGYDGTSWYVLDQQQDYTDYDNRRSEYFEIQNENAYQSYRIVVREIIGNSATACPRIAQLSMSSPDAPFITWTASSAIGINKDKGFLPTDVGRVIRIEGHDHRWRWFDIIGVPDETTIQTQMRNSEPFAYRKICPKWRLGMFSDTTGWPIDGTFFEDRFWVGGAVNYPDTVASSRVGNFENFRGSSPRNVVLDDHGINVRMLSKQLSRIKWMAADEQGVLVGTGVCEFSISSPNDEALTARNIKARPLTRRGGANIEPVIIDDQVFNVQLNRRSLNVLGYHSATRDNPGGYTNPSVTDMASHLAFPFVEQIEYAQEPNGIVWARREDGTMVAMTYDKDADIAGGHKHDFGGYVEHIAVLPSPADGQDTLWMVIRRDINGVETRCIEWLVKYWDFGDTINLDAQYVDSSLRYLGTVPASYFYGAYHLAGSLIDVLADGVQYRDIPVDVNGKITLPNPALYVVGGRRMRAQAEIQAMESGAADGGTAQGKAKRPNLVVVHVWDSYGGHVGRYNDDSGEREWTPIEYPENYADLDPVSLQTCFTTTLTLPMGYGPRGSISFYSDDLFPLNVIALLPQLFTQDR